MTGIGRWRLVPRVRTALVTGAAAVVGGVVAGPVAALVAAAYVALGTRALLRRRAVAATDQLRRRQLDDLGALAADLRAGLPVPVGLAGEEHIGAVSGGTGSTTVVPPSRLDRLARAAARLADRTGAPLAELVERIEADARAVDRGLAAAAAQAAGARATAWLLAALPLGGIVLGYTVGVDPVGVLLHTPVGAACALGATGLQTVGLLWAERLGAPPHGVR
ncbi:hypothetical protein [Micromonospora cathayae]|uniref:hypothetical protein n=1 Tax=Micromonospora cathayae TaxID=3028804 RepID=UPI003C6D9351